MLNPFHEINWRPGRLERRRFAAGLAVGFPCIGAVLLAVQWWHGAPGNFGPALFVGGLGAAVGALLWLVPQIAWPFYVVWYGAACGVGFVMGNAALAAVYLLLLAPAGLAMRAGGRKALSKGFDRSAPSYWREAPPRDNAGRYYRQF